MSITRKQAGEAADAFAALLVDAEALEAKVYRARRETPHVTMILDAVGYQAGALRSLLKVALQSASAYATPVKKVRR